MQAGHTTNYLTPKKKEKKKKKKRQHDTQNYYTCVHILTVNRMHSLKICTERNNMLR